MSRLYGFLLLFTLVKKNREFNDTSNIDVSSICHLKYRLIIHRYPKSETIEKIDCSGRNIDVSKKLNVNFIMIF